MMTAIASNRDHIVSLHGSEEDVRAWMRFYAALGYWCVGARV